MTWALKITLIFNESSYIIQQSCLETTELIDSDRTEW